MPLTPRRAHTKSTDRPSRSVQRLTPRAEKHRADRNTGSGFVSFFEQLVVPMSGRKRRLLLYITAYSQYSVDIFFTERRDQAKESFPDKPDQEKVTTKLPVTPEQQDSGDENLPLFFSFKPVNSDIYPKKDALSKSVVNTVTSCKLNFQLSPLCCLTLITLRIKKLYPKRNTPVP